MAIRTGRAEVCDEMRRWCTHGQGRAVRCDGGVRTGRADTLLVLRGDAIEYLSGGHSD